MKPILTAFFLTLVACGAAGCGGGELPRTGTWNYIEAAPRNDKCKVNAYVDTDGEFGIKNRGDGTFRVYPQNGTHNFNCELDASDDYVCGPRSTYDIDVPHAAKVTLGADVIGHFDHAERTTGEQHAVLECVGIECDRVEADLGITFPCPFIVDYTAVFVGPGLYF